MEIGPADTGAVPDVVDLWVALARGQRKHGSHIDPESNRETVQDRLTRAAIDDNVLVARADGRLVGFVDLEMERGEYTQTHRRGIVRNLYVVPERRDEGIGTELLAAAEDRLLEQGAERVALEVMADNEAATRFYREAGYDPHRIQLETDPKSDTL